jgi:hypothetical protein
VINSLAAEVLSAGVLSKYQQALQARLTPHWASPDGPCAGRQGPSSRLCCGCVGPCCAAHCDVVLCCAVLCYRGWSKMATPSTSFRITQVRLSCLHCCLISVDFQPRYCRTSVPLCLTPPLTLCCHTLCRAVLCAGVSAPCWREAPCVGAGRGDHRHAQHAG